MQPITYSANKHFIPVANKPLIFYPIETAANSGIKEAAITYNPGWLEFVSERLGDGSRWGMQFTYILQEKPIGLANIVQVCEEYINGDSFMFHLGDNIFPDGLQKFIDYFEREKPDGLLPMLHHPENTRLGVPYFDDNGRLIKYVEKPKDPPHDFGVPGVYFGSANAFKCFYEDPIKPSERGEYEIPSVFQWLVDHGYRVDVLEYEGKWLDPGKFGDWIESNQYLLDTKLITEINSDIEGAVKVEGRVKIGTNCHIENSVIRGPVAIGNNVHITNSYLGPFTSISDNCLIEKSHVENSVLMNNVTIKSVSQPIDESLIGSESEIIDKDSPTNSLNLFIGEKCKIKL